MRACISFHSRSACKLNVFSGCLENLFLFAGQALDFSNGANWNFEDSVFDYFDNVANLTKTWATKAPSIP